MATDTSVDSITITGPDGQSVETTPEELQEAAAVMRHDDSPYAICNFGEEANGLRARSYALSAFDQLSAALQVPADRHFGTFDRLDDAYAGVLRALDDLGNCKSQLRKTRDAMVAAGNFDQLELQFAPARR